MRADGVVDEIKNRLDIVEVVGDYLELRRAGANYKACCPFHNEKTPSFMVNPERQIYHCFGCGAGGDLFSFVMKQEGLEFREALELLAKRAGVELKPLDPQERKARQGREAIRDMQGLALKYFTQSLKKNQKAGAYIKSRGITDESVEHFSLGLAPEGWHHLYDLLKKNGYKDDDILHSGLVAKGQRGPYDIFRDRVMFPIFDRHGEPLAFGGRVMGQGEPKYLNSSDSPIFKKSETLYALDRARDGIRAKNYTMVVEGYLDAIMCHQHGINNVVAPLGTALTSGQLRILKRLSPNVLLVFDGDNAGMNAARRSLGIALEQEMSPKVLTLPAGEDPDSILTSQGAEGMKSFIARSQKPMEFLMCSGGGDRVGAIKAAVAAVAKVTDPIMRDELLQELAAVSGSREQTLREELRRTRPRGEYGQSQGRPQPQRRNTRMLHDAEVLLLSAALQEPARAADILEQVETGEILNVEVRELLVRLAQAKDMEGLDPLELARTDQERALITRLAVDPGFDTEMTGAIVEDCIRKLANKRRERELGRLKEELRRAEQSGDIERQKQLKLEHVKLLQGAR